MQSNSIAKLAAVLPLLVASQAGQAQNADRKFDSATRNGGQLEVHTSDGRYVIKPYSAGIVETTFVPNGEQIDPASHAVVLAPAAVRTTLTTKVNSIEYATPGIVVTITKSPFQISYAYKGKRLVAEKHGYVKIQDDLATGSKDINKGEARQLEGIEFALDKDEALYGAGERAVGMNRRGHRFTLQQGALRLRRQIRTDGLRDAGRAVVENVRAPLRQSTNRLPRFRQQEQRQPDLLDHRRPQDLPGDRGRQLGRRGGQLHQPDRQTTAAAALGLRQFRDALRLPQRGRRARHRQQIHRRRHSARRHRVRPVLVRQRGQGHDGQPGLGQGQLPRRHRHDRRLPEERRADGGDHRAIYSRYFQQVAGSGRQEGAGHGRQRRAAGLRLLLRPHGPDRHLRQAGQGLVLEHLQGPARTRRDRRVGRPGRTGSASGRDAPRHRQRRPGAQHLRPSMGAAGGGRLSAGLPDRAPFHPDARRVFGHAALRHHSMVRRCQPRLGRLAGAARDLASDGDAGRGLYALGPGRLRQHGAGQ